MENIEFLEDVVRKHSFKIIISIWILCILAFVYFGYFKEAEVTGNVDLIDTIKKIDTKIKLLGDKEYSLAEILNKKQNKYTLLVFYNPVGDPNIKVIKMIEDIDKNKVLEMNPILIGVGEAEKINDFVIEKGLKYENYTISWDEFKKFIINGKVPLIAIVDKKGRVKFSSIGWDSQNGSKLFIKKTFKYK